MSELVNGKICVRLLSGLIYENQYETNESFFNGFV